ncbi:MAG TPA: SH3 domain-containing protein [Steroidobacteraceae bacterium]
MLRRLTVLCLSLGLLASVPAGAAQPAILVVVKDPYIDLHTGPGRGFPITLSIERGMTVELVRQRTDWVEVRTSRGQHGWVNRSQLAETLTLDGREVKIAGPPPDARISHKWELGVATGQMSGANIVSVNGAYLLTDNLLLRADAAQMMGQSSNGWLGTVGIAHTFMPQWLVSPFVGVGAGVVHVTPKATLIDTRERTDTAAYGAIGFRGYLSDRFLLQAEYRGFVVFTNRDDNQENDEWLVGFTYFF